MAIIPKGINRFKLTSGVKNNIWEWKKGKSKQVIVKPIWSSSKKRYVSNWKVCATGFGTPKKRIFKTDEQAIKTAIRLMRKK